MSGYSGDRVMDRAPPRCGPIFISHASADRGHAEAIVGFLEAHGLECWVSYRDVGLGENYQEAITAAIRSATALIVIVSRHANSSIEIPKELSLASRNRLPVMPLRVEIVQLNAALAYELSTHRWVDLFDDWKAGCQRLLSQLTPRQAALTAMPRRTMPLRKTLPPPLAVAARPVPPVAARAASPGVAAVKFLFVALVFFWPLYGSLQQGGPSPLDLVFWAILVAGCARLIGAILGGFVAIANANRRDRAAAGSEDLHPYVIVAR